MRFQEIVTEMDRVPQSDMDDRKIREGIKRAKAYQAHGGGKSFGTIGDVTVMTDVTSEHFTFVHGGRTLGYAMLEPSKNPSLPRGKYMTEIGLLPELRGRSIGLEFYLLLLQRGETIIAGAQQTPDGQNVWRKLMQRPDVRVDAGRFTWTNDAMGWEPVRIAAIDPWSDGDLFLTARRK